MKDPKNTTLIGNEFVDLLHQYTKDVQEYLSLIKEYSPERAKKEENDVKDVFKKYPEIYGVKDRNARTTEQWQQRINYVKSKQATMLCEKEHFIANKRLSKELDYLSNKCFTLCDSLFGFTKDTFNLEISKSFKNVDLENGEEVERARLGIKHLEKTINRLKKLDKIHDNLIEINLDSGLSIENAKSAAKELIATKVPLNEFFSNPENFDLLRHDLANDVKNFERALQNCANKYQEIYGLDKDQSFAQIQKEFEQSTTEHSTAANLSFSHKLEWLNKQEILMEEEKNLHEACLVEYKTLLESQKEGAGAELLHANLTEKDSGLLKSTEERHKILAEIYTENMALLENTLRNKGSIEKDSIDNSVNTAAISKSKSTFTHSETKLGGKNLNYSKEHYSHIYQTPGISFYDGKDNQPEEAPTTKQVHVDEKILEAQQQALRVIKDGSLSQVENSRKRDSSYLRGNEAALKKPRVNAASPLPGKR